MLDFIFFLLLVPATLLWLVYRAIEDLLALFGFWLGPGVLFSYYGIYLFLLGPSSPNAVYQSVFQWLAGSVILGLRVPLLLVMAGAGMLLVGACRHFLCDFAGRLLPDRRLRTVPGLMEERGLEMTMTDEAMCIGCGCTDLNACFDEI